MSSLTHPFDPQPLPKAAKFDAHGNSHWAFLLDAEDAALSARVPKFWDNLIATRVLGHFFVDFWRHRYDEYAMKSYDWLIEEITFCRKTVEGVEFGSPEEKQTQFEKVYQLGRNYRNFLLRVFRSNAGPTPGSEQHASRPSFDKTNERIIDEMRTAEKTKGDAKKRALLRDGYKCMITGAYDHASCKKYPELDALVIAQGSAVENTQCAHLFSGSAQDSDKDLAYAANEFAMLEMFGFGDVVKDLLGGNINNLANFLTMTHKLHTWFDTFNLWLEPVPGEPDTYTFCSRRPYHLYGLPSKVTFQVDPAVLESCEAKGIPPPALPDSRLIGLRAACARVARMSGAAEQVDRILEDQEDIEVMAEDGSTADLLYLLMMQVPTVDITGVNTVVNSSKH